MHVLSEAKKEPTTKSPGFTLVTSAPTSSSPERPANFSRFMFLDPRAHDFYPDWQLATEMNVAILRRIAGTNPQDQRLAKLVGELSMRGDRFRELWASHNVRCHYAGRKSFRHPVVGLLEVNYVSLELTGDPGLVLTTYTATPAAPPRRPCGCWPAGRRRTGSPSRPGRGRSPPSADRGRPLLAKAAVN